MATYADMEELIRLGAYRAGSSAEVDEAIRLHEPLEAFLRQAKDEVASLGDGYRQLEQILDNFGNGTLTLSGHHPRHTISDAGGAPEGRRLLSRVQIGTSGEYELMKSRETLIRLKKFQVDEKRRRVAQIEGMIADFQRMSVDLEREIQTEQERAGINDPTHFAYPTYAKAAIQRRENLTRSADELRIQLEDAKACLAEAFEELKKVELLDERDQARERAEESAREQADLDSIGLMRARLGAIA